jgi:phage-related protein
VANKKRPVSGWLSRMLDGHNVKGTDVCILEATCSYELRGPLCGETGTIHSARKDKRQGNHDKLQGLVHDVKPRTPVI